MSAARRGLGRGLSALFGDTETALDDEVAGAARGGAAAGEAEQSERLTAERLVPIGRLRSGRFQPRKEFDQQAIDDLSESIREKGIIQPILVRKHPDEADLFEIIAGERRWRAAQQAQLHEVPVLVKSFTDREALEVALVENLQRQDLTPLEESEGYQRLMDEFHHTQEDLAKAVGKSRSHVANMMRLLNLPDPVKGMLREGKLTAGHARALLNAEDPVTLAERVVSRGLNVRQTEKLAVTEGKKQPRKKGATASDGPGHKDADTVALERDLSQLLGLKVSILFAGRGGSLTVEYDTLEQLDDILHRLSNGIHKLGGTEEALSEDEDIGAAIASDLAGAPEDEEDDGEADEIGPAGPFSDADADADADADTDAEENLKETVWEGGLDAVDLDEAVPEGDATEAAPQPPTVEEAEEDLRATLTADGLDGLDWSAEAGEADAVEAEEDTDFDPDAMKQVLREEGLDALYDAEDLGEAEDQPAAEDDDKPTDR